MIGGLFNGATYPLRALNLVRRSPRLLQFFIIPWLVNGVVGGLLYASLFIPLWRGLRLFVGLVDQRVDQWLSGIPSWLHFLEVVVLALAHLVQWGLVLGLLFLIGLLLLQFGTLIGAPWYGQLSEAIEQHRFGQVITVEVGFFEDIGRALLFEVKKIVLWLMGAPVLLALNFIPGAGPAIATGGGMVLTGLIVCLDFLDGPSERRRLKFRQKLKFALRSLPASASFSFVCCVMMSVPLINLLTIPLCVAAGTLFWCDHAPPRLRDFRTQTQEVSAGT